MLFDLSKFMSLVIIFQARDTDGCLTHLLQAIQDQFLPVLFALIKNRLILFCVSFLLPNLDQKILVLWEALPFILCIVFGSTFWALQCSVPDQPGATWVCNFRPDCNLPNRRHRKAFVPKRLHSWPSCFFGANFL